MCTDIYPGTRFYWSDLPNTSWINVAVNSFSVSHPLCLSSNLVFPNHERGRNLSAALASSPSSLLSITVHWCFSPLLLYSSSLLLPRWSGGKRAACLHTSGQDWWLVNSISQHCRPHWCRTKSINPSKVLNICAPQPGVTISFISQNVTFLQQVLLFCFLECFASSFPTFQRNYGLRFQNIMSPWNVTSNSKISIKQPC